jgi:tetratricopeptide (TPR) repeat protein
VGPVTEQSEHLSSAQIENYGNRTSGAGPDTAQGDERQRVDHQSSDDQSMTDQSVEAHLADCPSCRNRVLDFHRRRFALLAQPERAGSASSSPGLANSRLADERPTDSALADSKFANSKYPVQAQVRTAPTPECPSSDALRQFAAGLTPDALAAKLTQHAATCDHCGPLLRTFTEDFSDDFTPEEQAALANLQSSSAKWQKTTARKMLEVGGVKTARVVKENERKPFLWKWVLVPAIAAVVAVAAIIFPIYLAQRDTPEKVDKLLAKAYTEQRTMEMRWPGANYSALSSQERGNLGHQPASLFQAKSIILDHLSAHRDDAKWLHALGREEILEWRTEEALNDLKHALELSPNSVPIMVDLAMAHFQRAERSQNVIDYAEAIELLGKALAINPDDPNTLFNRALLYQRMSPPLYESALNDWNHFLAVERHGPWSDEARRHKHEIEELKKNSSATN